MNKQDAAVLALTRFALSAMANCNLDAQVELARLYAPLSNAIAELADEANVGGAAVAVGSTSATDFGAMAADPLSLAELRAIRAELKSIRVHFGARPEALTGDERFAHMPPPHGAKNGHWHSVVGSAQPVWIERPVEVYNPATGTCGPQDAKVGGQLPSSSDQTTGSSSSASA